MSGAAAIVSPPPKEYSLGRRSAENSLTVDGVGLPVQSPPPRDSSSPPVEALCMPPIAATPCAMVWYGPECLMSCDVACEMRQFIALGAGWEMVVSAQPCVQ